jgi:hypothetical protein
MKIVSASVDLTKIDKSRIIEKNGAKYWNFSILVNDENDKYGNDIAITDGQTKEERDAKVKRNFVGNGKTVFDSAGSAQPAKQAAAPKQSNSDDLGF